MQISIETALAKIGLQVLQIDGLLAAKAEDERTIRDLKRQLESLSSDKAPATPPRPTS